MFKTACKFTTDKGVINGGAIVDQKELDKHFSAKEQEEFKTKGLIISLVPKEEDSETDNDGINVDTIAIEDITVEYVEGLKQKQLVALKTRLGLETEDNKVATLKPAIIEAISGDEGDNIDLDEMDEEALLALAAEEEIELPDDADIEQIRDIIAEAMEA